MILVPGHARRARLGLLVFVLGFAFVLVAPIGLFAVPLAALLLASPDRSASLVVAASFVGGVGCWWLLSVGDPAEQLVRAGCLLATATFLVLSHRTKWTVIHRALMAIVVACGGAALTVRLAGTTWSEIVWWTEQRAIITQSYVMQLWLASRSGADGFLGAGGGGTASQAEATIRALPDMMTTLFPATFAVQMVAGLTLATFVVARIGIRVPGLPVRRFDEFRFSEHLGWPVVVASGIALLAEKPALRIPAVNILMLASVLYGIRGAAIVSYYWRRRRTSRLLVGTMAVLAVLVLWRVAIPAIVLLGLLDTGLDLRKRMMQSQ